MEIWFKVTYTTKVGLFCFLLWCTECFKNICPSMVITSGPSKKHKARADPQTNIKHGRTLSFALKHLDFHRDLRMGTTVGWAMEENKQKNPVGKKETVGLLSGLDSVSLISFDKCLISLKLIRFVFPPLPNFGGARAKPTKKRIETEIKIHFLKVWNTF